MVAAGVAVWVVLLAAAGALLAGGLLLLVLAPVLAGSLATSTSRPRLERRASGPDRMRSLITSQRTARTKRSGFRTALTRSGIALVGLSVVALIAGGILAATGAGM